MYPLGATWSRILRLHWLLPRRGLVGSILIAVGMGIVIGVAGHFLGLPATRIRVPSTGLGLLVGAVRWVAVLGTAFWKKCRGFRVMLVPE